LNNLNDRKSKAVRKQIANGSLLPVMEEFFSLQGEGFHTGKAAYFVRIGGCDVGCSWCDVKESWNADIHPLVKTEQVIADAVSCRATAAVITGGEPLLYNLKKLCLGFKKNGIKTFLETSGTQPLSGKWNWICLSPKKNSSVIPEIYTKANELKVIIHSSADLSWAEENASQMNKNAVLFMQPEWSRRKEVMEMIVEYIKKNPKWVISLQSHKYMNIP
jgi:7-carboxy-7-deazaguanine synthase